MRPPTLHSHRLLLRRSAVQPRQRRRIARIPAAPIASIAGAGRARKTLLYNYSQLFMRAYDYDGVHPLAQKGTPRQRRLMGDLGYDWRPGSYFYVPEDQVEVITGGDR